MTRGRCRVAGTPYGPPCGKARGLTGGRRRVRVWQPAKARVEQPMLFGLDEIETNESEEE